MVDVRVTDGQLTVWWPNKAQPVANLKGHSRMAVKVSASATFERVGRARAGR